MKAAFSVSGSHRCYRWPGEPCAPVIKVDGEIGGRRDDDGGMRGAETPTPIGGSDGRAPVQVRFRCEADRSMPC